MRAITPAIIALSLAACDSGQVPSPADRLAGEVPVEAVDQSLVTLRAEGLSAGAESFYFAAGRSEVEHALGQVLGEPLSRNEIAECGAGPMEMSSFAGELTVNFQGGSLVGWNIGTATGTAAENIVTGADVAIGMRLDELAKLPGYSLIENSTLGQEFSVNGKLGGFVEDGKVTTLYAGTQCFFR